MQELRLACRSLTRRPAFAIAAILMLSTGIAITVATFSVVDTVLLKPLPYPDPDRLVVVMEANPARAQQTSLIAPGRLEEWNQESRTFVALSGFYSESVTDSSGSEPERLAGRRVAPRYFTVLGTPALLGRTFAADEERFGGPATAVISEGFWMRRYGRTPDVLTRALIVDGTRYTIVGVMPATFAPPGIDVWLPAQTPPGLLRVRQARFLSGIGRIRAGFTRESAAADLVRVQESLGQRYPATDEGWSVEVAGLKEARVGSYGQGLLVVFAAVVLLLAIAVANVAGLMLVRLHRQSRELAIRQAIGGSRTQVVRGVMHEVVLLTVTGVSGGSVAAWWLTRLIGQIFVGIPRVNELTLDWRALLFAAIVAAAAAMVFGLSPALHVTSHDPAALLAQASARHTHRRHGLQQALVVGQVALGILVAASAGLLLRTYYNLAHVDAGFATAHVVTFHVGAAWNEDRTRIGQMQEQLLSDLQNRPEIVEAGLTNFLPATGATLRYQVKFAGASATEEGGMLTIGERTVSAGYLRALSIPLLSGSWCPPLRLEARIPAPALVNRAFADRYGLDVLGRRFTFDQVPGEHEIVGVVGNVIEDGARASAAPYVYACQQAGEWPDPDYVVLGRGDSRRTVAAIREVVRHVAPTRAFFGLRMVDDVVAASLDQPRWSAEALSLFAAAAILLASVGLYSLLMLVVTESTPEIGIRIALGARPSDVARLVLGAAGRLTAAGVGTGLLLVWATTRLLRASLFSVSSLDLSTLAASVAMFCVVTVIAAGIPLRRAVATDAIAAIRTS